MADEQDPCVMETEIRHMAAQDARTVSEILQSAPEASDWSEASVRDSLLDKKVIGLVSVCGDEICGCIFGVNIAGEAEILNLAVKFSHRRRGIGAELVRQMLSEWAQQGTQRVFLEVRESNAGAIELYERLGFRRVGRRKAYYSSPVEDALVLERPNC